MTNPQELQAAGPLTLSAVTAADLMTPNLVSFDRNATAKEAAAFLTDRGFSAARVNDEAGRTVGVVSRADVVVHHRQKSEYVPAVPDYYERSDLATLVGHGDDQRVGGRVAARRAQRRGPATVAPGGPVRDRGDRRRHGLPGVAGGRDGGRTPAALVGMAAVAGLRLAAIWWGAPAARLSCSGRGSGNRARSAFVMMAGDQCGHRIARGGALRSLREEGA
jgi:hypothetical protein